MKTIFKKIGLSLATLVCAVCAGVGVAMSIPQAAKSANADAVALSDSNFYISGAGARLINDANGAGIRFHTNLLASEYANVQESGTLIIPDFRYDGELTLDDLSKESKYRPTHIVTKGTVDGKAVDYWRDAPTDGFKRATVYLYNIPEVGYGTRMVVSSYVKINGEYIYTSVIEGSNYISLSDVATKAGAADAALKDRLQPFVVETVKVTYVMPDGSKQTEEVAYGETLQGPSFESDGYVINGLTDQYGKAVNLNTYKATTPVTITVDLGLAQNETTITTQIVKDGYGATAPERAFINGSTGTTVTEGVPAGYGGSALRLDWYKDSTSLWKANGNPFYRSCYNQNDISGYNSARFAIKLETSGDACIQIYPKQTNRNQEGVVRNEWLGIELVQTSTNLWTLTITNLDKGEVIATYENVVRNNNGLNDVDSVASLVFSACKWDNASPTLMLQPCTTTDMTASIYTTPLFVYTDKIVPSADATEIDDTAFCDWGWGVNNNKITALPEMVEDVEAPVGFNKVSKITSSTGWTSSSLSSDFFSTLDITNYSEVWAAYKAVNGKFTQTKPTWTDIDSNAASDWIYFHFTQTGETTDSGYLLWDIEIIKNDTVWGIIEDQHCNNALNNIQKLFNHHEDDNGRIVQYHSGSGTAEFYATELRGILKDGVAEDTDKTIEIPEEAIAVRAYPWRDDKYTTGKNEILTEGAPDGFTQVLKHTWSADKNSEYTYCFDTTLDITKYSDLYLATKLENGTHVYVRNGGGHYAGQGWLYAHYHQVSAGVWQPTFASDDGYYAAPSATISATTIKALIEGNLYGHANSAGMGTISYWTEILAKSETQGERVIWSAVDGAKLTDDAVGAPAGFTSTYKKEGFTPSDFASLDLTNTIYQELRFGMIAKADLTFKAGYKYKFAEEATERPTTSIMYNTGSYPQMYMVNLTNNGGNSWTVTMNVKRWVAAPASGGSSAQIPDTEPFTATVTGSSLSEIMSTFLNNSNVTIYVTEVRGTHTCVDASGQYVSNGNGTHNEVCYCGKVIQEGLSCSGGEATCIEQAKCALCGGAYGELSTQHVEMTIVGKTACSVCNTILDENDTQVLRYAIWRDDGYGLESKSSTTVEAPLGFSNVAVWNSKTGYGSGGNDLPNFIFDLSDDLTPYSDVYFAWKTTSVKGGVYVNGYGTYQGGDWLYGHFHQEQGVWTLSVYTLDGSFRKDNVQTISAEGYTFTEGSGENVTTYTYPNLKGLTMYNSTYKKGFCPNRGGDTSEECYVYMTDVIVVENCDGSHSVTRIVSNEDGTHNEVCAACGEVVAENVACSGGEATCTAGAICSACGYKYEAATGHNAAWTLGKYVCSTCDEVVDTAETVAASAIVDAANNEHLTPATNEAGITAPEGFSSVTNFFSASGNMWSYKILGGSDFAGADLTAFSEVWFAIAIEGGHFTNTADNWKNLDADNKLVWVSFHLTQTATETWTVEIKVDGVLYNTFAGKPGKTIYNIIENNNNGLRLVIYQQTDGTNSNADVNIYATEVLGAFQTGISENAEKVWDHIWNADNVGTYVDETAPRGFEKVNKVTWSGTAANNYWPSGKVNSSTSISAYSDLWFAMKVENTDIFVQGFGNYTGGNWMYVHLHQNDDGTWSKTFRTPDGMYDATKQSNLNYNNLKVLLEYLSGTNRGSYPNWVGPGVEGVVYTTELIGVKKCDGVNHTADSIVSHGNGTHSVTCRCGVAISENVACSGGKATCTQLAKCSICGGEYGDYAAHVAVSYVSNGDGTHNAICACGEVVNANVACAGGVASCTEAAVCSTCKASYGEALGHSGKWEGDEYICERCGESCGDVTTVLDHQNVALFTDAPTITANEETAATIDLSSATDLNITEVKSVALDSMNYTATVSGNKVSFNVMPNSVFGEYVATATVLVEGKEFEITVPVTIVTNMITTPMGMLNMKYVLRGKTDVAKVADTTAQTETYLVYQGGTGGAATMNGDGYYMLGADIALIQDGGNNTNVYVWGTKAVPFVGTFDGNGHVLSGFKKTNWFSGHTLEDVSVTGSYANELEGSLFGVLNGKVKNVAFTGARFGIYANLVLDGTGVLEDVYVGISDLQDNANVYVAPIFWRNTETVRGTLRNVVINLENHSSQYVKDNGQHTATTQYPALMKNIKAENVAVYGFNAKWVHDGYNDYDETQTGTDMNADGDTEDKKININRGNIYSHDSVFNNGSEAGIYVEYADSSTNGADFWGWNLDTNLWKFVDNLPYLKNVSVEGTATEAPTGTYDQTNDNYIVDEEGGSEYYIAWDNAVDGSYDAIDFIRDTFKTATGKTLKGGSTSNSTDTKQIIIGSYEDYVRFLPEDPIYTGATYGVYLEGRTFFVLAENEESYLFAAQELCRKLFGWNQVFFAEGTYYGAQNNIVCNTNVTNLTLPEADKFNYTTNVAFSYREFAGSYNGKVAGEVSDMKAAGQANKIDFGFTGNTPFNYYKEMHNSLDYFHGIDANNDGEVDAGSAYTGTMAYAKDANGNVQLDSEGNKVQICYLGGGDSATFNAMVDHVVGRIVATALANPNMKTINFMIEDNAYYCKCTACQKFKNDSNTTTVTTLAQNNSVTQLIFLNAVANKLATNETLVAAGRTIAVECFAYGLFSDAPLVGDASALTNINNSFGLNNETTTVTYKNGKTATVLKAADNLRVWWTSHKANHSFGLEHAANEHMLQSLQGWIASIGAENVDVFMYEATYRDFFMPLNTWQYQLEWYKTLNKLGVNSHMFNLGNTFNYADKQSTFSAFKTYIDARAMRDINVSYETLKAEFFGVNGYYGAAGPTMEDYFDELVAVMESLKQVGSSSSDYINPIELALDGFDVNANASDAATARQAFFNGHYGYSMMPVVFGSKKTSGLGSATVTPDDIFTYNGMSEKETLERWYSYCETALGMVDANSEYAERIKVEALFPEYAYLVLESTYKTTAKWNSSGKKYSGDITATKGDSAKFTRTYQEFYNHMKDLGMVEAGAQPSEFWAYNSGAADDEKTTKYMTTVADGMFGTYGLYFSWYMNWGISF